MTAQKSLLLVRHCFRSMSRVIESIREELKAEADEKTKKTFQRFFREEAKFYGVKNDKVRKIAKKYWNDVKALDKSEVFSLCEQLYRSDYTEEAFVVAVWLQNLIGKFELSDLAVFRCWIEKYINNWAKCDWLCNHTIGDLIERCPESISELKSWAKSENRWLRRAAAASLIIPARKGRFLQDIFEISDILLSDKDDKVQKGYGWMLKEASRKHQKEVFNYVLNNQKTMPRTALRIATEHMPKELKKEAMRRD